MTNQPKVSVIVPVYNAAKWLPATFRSFENQTYSNIEWILVDDGSRDDSAGLCASWCYADRLRRSLVRKKNGGASSARNVGLDHATGEFVLFWDSDDEQDPTAVERMVNSVPDNNGVAVCAVRCVADDGEEHDLFICQPDTVTPVRALEEWLLGRVSTGPITKLVPRRLLGEAKIRFEEGIINEDVLWTAQVFGNADSIALMGEPLYRYVAHEGSVTKSFGSNKLDVFDNCRKLENYIKQRYPSLVGPCACYCARSCWNVALAASRGDSKRDYPEVYRGAMRELDARKTAIAKYCTTPKERLLRLLVRTGIYGLLKK